MILINTSAISGSNWVPLCFFISLSASSFVNSFLYNRFDVIASYESTIAIILADNGMSLPFNWLGYPLPSNLSWWYRTQSNIPLFSMFENKVKQ